MASQGYGGTAVDNSWSGSSDEALASLMASADAASEVQPVHIRALEQLLGLGRRKEAETLFDHVNRLPARSADALDGLAFYARRLDRHERSNELYRDAVACAPGDPRFWHNLATSERSLGRLDLAIDACNRALALGGDTLPILLLRSEIARATPEGNHVGVLKRRLERPSGDRERMFAGYALGKELHDLGRYDEAFHAFAAAAAARRRNLSYDVAEDEQKLRRIEEAFPRPNPPARPSPPASKARHIFIVGLPRSGTTLTERILSGLPGARSNGETDNFASALLSCAPGTGADVFERCARADPSAVGRAYQQRSNPDASPEAVIEKLPLNYLYLGAIAAALPTAALVWVRRHPLDSCFAMFRTLFAHAYPFTYDFEDLARYYAAYDRLMRHWGETLGERLLAVDYEQLVSDPSRLGGALAAHCGLEWSDAALDLPRNQAASLTASATQVREPIYTRSAGLWRRYRAHLEPLARRLEELGVSAPLE